ncbi:uncharacterized protein C19orf44 homolog isoform X2 [Narcine bancroftii]|uniref:uncharacterized protein C19orf44 homolog isoform X2 n=1 Tax=Narcine bancroftii TaxID=1343680 RepID=UPI0038314AE3
MFRRSGLGSSALARAQAQLSGQRILESFNIYGDELQDYMTACKKNNSLMVSPFSNEISDPSDLSIEDNGVGKTAARVKPAEGISEQPFTSNRFLKKADKLAVAKNLKMSNCAALKKGNEADNKSFNAAPARVRSSKAVLGRLAQIENKIMNRKLNKHQISSENLQMSDDEQLSPKSSTELSGKGSRFLKRMVNTASKPEFNAEIKNEEMDASKKDPHRAHLRPAVRVATIGSNEEEAEKMLGGSLEFSESELPKRSRGTPQHVSKLHKQPVLRNYSRGSLRMPSPPSLGSPQLSLPLRMKNATSIPTSSTEQSEIQSLDDLFTEPSLAEDVRSLDNETFDEFRLNILSLEDLIPTAQQKSTKNSLTLKNEESEHLGDQSTQSGFQNSRLKMINNLVSSCLQPTKLSEEKDVINLENEISTEFDATGSEISECLNEDSNVSKKEEKSPEKVPEQLEENDQSTMSSKYSEDFETSDCAVTSVKMDQNEPPFEQSSQEELRTNYSDNTFNSTSSSPTPDQSKMTISTESSYSVKKTEQTRVTVKDTAMQTQPPGFHYTWHRDEGVAVLGASLGAAYVDPTPIASHIISPEAIEALTAYSPATLALNDMLKQQLSLTRQFVQVHRHLYLTILASIEQDKYHYTTLEETKEFVQNHRSPPLTLEQALKEVQEEMKQYHNT